MTLPHVSCQVVLLHELLGTDILQTADFGLKYLTLVLRKGRTAYATVENADIDPADIEHMVGHTISVVKGFEGVKGRLPTMHEAQRMLRTASGHGQAAAAAAGGAAAAAGEAPPAAGAAAAAAGEAPPAAGAALLSPKFASNLPSPDISAEEQPASVTDGSELTDYPIGPTMRGGIEYTLVPGSVSLKWAEQNPRFVGQIDCLAHSKGEDWQDFYLLHEIEDCEPTIVFGLQSPARTICSFCTLSYEQVGFTGSPFTTRTVMIANLLSNSRGDASGKGIVNYVEEYFAHQVTFLKKPWMPNIVVAAEVLCSNVPSVKSFKAQGFTEVDSSLLWDPALGKAWYACRDEDPSNWKFYVKEIAMSDLDTEANAAKVKFDELARTYLQKNPSDVALSPKKLLKRLRDATNPRYDLPALNPNTMLTALIKIMDTAKTLPPVNDKYAELDKLWQAERCGSDRLHALAVEAGLEVSNGDVRKYLSQNQEHQATLQARGYKRKRNKSTPRSPEF